MQKVILHDIRRNIDLAEEVEVDMVGLASCSLFLNLDSVQFSSMALALDGDVLATIDRLDAEKVRNCRPAFDLAC